MGIKKCLFGIGLGLLIAAPAMAADMPARMPVKAPPAMVAAQYNWTGFYIGGHAGYGWGDADWEFLNFPAANTLTDHRVRGFVGGLHTGLQWQTGRFVFGVEGSVSKTGMDGSSPCPVAAIGCETEIDHFWRVGARAGMAFGAAGNWLLYGTGGFARANVESRTTLIGTGDKTHHHGWYAGAGLDWGVTPNIILGVEAYHVSLGSQEHFLPGGIIVPFNTRDIDLDFSVVQARATYLFNWGAPLVARY